MNRPRLAPSSLIELIQKETSNYPFRRKSYEPSSERVDLLRDPTRSALLGSEEGDFNEYFFSIPKNIMNMWQGWHERLQPGLSAAAVAMVQENHEYSFNERLL